MGRSHRVAVILILALAGLGVLLPHAAFAATIHLMVVADTLDPKIGKNVEVDARAIEFAFRENIPEDSHVLSFTKLVGDDCTPEAIKAALDRLNIDPDDALVVFYQGHGAYDAQIGHYLKFPRLGDGFLARSDLGARLKAKGGRLTVIATDCCNKLSMLPSKSKPKSMYASKQSWNQVTPLFQSLFLNSAGFVDLTSSKRGEESISFPSLYERGHVFSGGGLFTTAIAQLFQRSGGTVATWDEIAERTSIVVRDSFHSLKPDGLDNPDEPEKPQMTQTVVAALDVRVLRPTVGNARQFRESQFFRDDPSDLNGPGRAQSLGVIGMENNGQGIYVYAVKPGSAAAKLGLEAGDVILTLNDNTLRTAFGYQQTLLRAVGAVSLIVRDVRTGQSRSWTTELDDAEFRQLPFEPAVGDPPQFGVAGTATLGALRIDAVTPGSPAGLLGLEPGDQITTFNGRNIRNQQELDAAVAASPDEARFDFIDVRGAQPRGMLVTLDRRTPALGRRFEERRFVVPERRNFSLGIHGIDNGGQGIRVQTTRPGSAAARHGFEAYDVIWAVDGQPIRSVREYVEAISNSNGQVTLTYLNVRTKQYEQQRVQLDDGSAAPAVAADKPQWGASAVPANGGLQVLTIVPGSAANYAGLDIGDVILEVNGAPVATSEDLRSAVRDSASEMYFKVRDVRTGRIVEMVTRLDR